MDINCVPKSFITQHIMRPTCFRLLGSGVSSIIYSLKEKSKHVDVMGRISKPIFVAFLVLGRRIFSASHAVSNVMVEGKYSVAGYDDWPRCVSIVWWHIWFVVVSRLFEFCSSVNTAVYFKPFKIARYELSVTYLIAVFGFGCGIGTTCARYI